MRARDAEGEALESKSTMHGRLKRADATAEAAAAALTIVGSLVIGLVDIERVGECPGGRVGVRWRVKKGGKSED